jgi:hypothetical protein
MTAATPLVLLARLHSELRRPSHDRDPEVLRAAGELLRSSGRPKVARALAYLEQHPGSSANEAAVHVGGRRADALAAVREARVQLGTDGNQSLGHVRVMGGFDLGVQVSKAESRR